MLLERLSTHSKVSPESLQWLALTASQRYKVYEIPKRNGGTRKIEHPSRIIKAVQRWISKYLGRRLLVHPAATAYSKGSSIRRNAEFHKNANFTLRIDFKDFFPSFSASDVANFLSRASRQSELELNEQDIEFIARICTRHGRLTIGAPSSPLLTNLMMFDFDKALSTFCSSSNQIYTRYADDVFVSTNVPNLLAETQAFIRQTSAAFPFGRLIINEEKTAFLSKRYHRSITGLVITSDNKLSIGRDRKREIKALVHKFSLGLLDDLELPRVRGLVTFCADCEPPFVLALEKKYGEATIAMLLGKAADYNVIKIY